MCHTSLCSWGFCPPLPFRVSRQPISISSAAVQKERLLRREVQALRADLDRVTLRASEAAACQSGLQQRVASLQREANEKDGLYHAKCKELSVAKLKGGPSGIGARQRSTAPAGFFYQTSNK